MTEQKSQPTADAMTDAMTDAPSAVPDQKPDIANLGYEAARDELASIVATLESGRAPLEESMKLWERGEALAQHCQRWLDGAQRRIDTAMAQRENRDADNSSDAAASSQE